MEVTLEALGVITNRFPVCVGLRGDVAVEDELEVGTALYMFVKGRMAGNSGGTAVHAEVEEVLQQVEFALCWVALAGAVVDVYLRVAHYIGMIHIEVVFLILHDGINIVVVSHRQRHIVRIGLT